MRERHDRGVALLIVLVTVTFLSALGAALTLATTTEVAIAANYREAAESLYAAEAGVAFVMQEVAREADWTNMAAAPARSTFVDGTPGGVRAIGAARIDLTTITIGLNRATTGATGAIPPRMLHAFGRLRDLVPSAGPSQVYVAVWVANVADAAGTGAVPGMLSILGQGYGPRGSRRSVEVLVEKMGAFGIRRRSWREWP